MMVVMLKTPGVQRIVGKSTALLTFTGRSTGRTYTTPLSYVELDDRIIVTGHRTRQWWKNLISNPEVEVRLAGVTQPGSATVIEDPDTALTDFVAVLEAQPMVAKISGAPLDADGSADPELARAALANTKVVSIDLSA